MAFGTIESTVLFDETRSGAIALSDDALAAELAHAILAYLGVRPFPAPTDHPAHGRNQ